MESTDAHDLVNKHLKSYFEQAEIFVFDELVSPDFHLDTYLILPAAERDFFTLMTAGVSSLPMSVPDPSLPAYIELMLVLPSDWPFTNDQWRNPEYYWPIELIKSLGRFPHQNHTWLGRGHTIPESKDSYLSSKGFVATCLLKSTRFPEEFQEIALEQGFIDVLMPIPLYPSEYEYKRKYGIQAFLEKMLVCEYLDIVNLNRAKIV